MAQIFSLITRSGQLFHSQMPLGQGPNQLVLGRGDTGCGRYAAHALENGALSWP